MELILVILLVPVAFVVWLAQDLFWTIFCYVGMAALAVALVVEVLKAVF